MSVAIEALLLLNQELLTPVYIGLNGNLIHFLRHLAGKIKHKFRFSAFLPPPYTLAL